MIWPTTGTLRIMRSTKCWKAGERLNAITVATMAKIVPNRNTHHHETMNREAATMILVNAGKSAPKLLKVSSNCGTTKISRMALTRIATAMTIAG